MNVTDAILSRKSIRAFLDRPVPDAVLREVLTTAARAPSGGNLQPWRIYVLTGTAMARFKQRMQQRVLEAPAGEPTEYDIYPPNLWDPYRCQRYVLGEQMYALLGVGRDDKAGRARQFARNYQFFGAPAGLMCYVDRKLGPPQWSDLGMYLQSVMLLLRERGLHSCPQECWSVYHETVDAFVGAPKEWMLFCGMSIGYADDSAPVNSLTSERAPLEQFATFVDDGAAAPSGAAP